MAKSHVESETISALLVFKRLSKGYRDTPPGLDSIVNQFLNSGNVLYWETWRCGCPLEFAPLLLLLLKDVWALVDGLQPN
jgi:hypothetical protein